MGPAPAPRRSQPGWGAVLGSSLGAAVLASGLTMGGLAVTGNLNQDQPQAKSSVTQPESAPESAPDVPLTAQGAVDWTAVAATVSPSVVSIQLSSPTAQGEGSGVILDNEGHVLTNDHVATGAGDNAKMVITTSDGRQFSDIRVVGQAPGSDLAVVQISGNVSELKPISLGDSAKVRVGQPVMALGSPLGLADTVTTGIVSALDRPTLTREATENGTSELVVTNAIQTDAAINPGNSGGALVDATGSLIGIPSSIATTADSAEAGSIGLGFATPVNEAKRVADELIATGKSTVSYLGTSLENGRAKTDGTTHVGAVVTEVLPDQAAAAAGIEPGDVIIGVDGEIVPSANSLMSQVRARAPGEKMSIELIREGRVMTLDATLGQRPNQ